MLLIPRASTESGRTNDTQDSGSALEGNGTSASHSVLQPHGMPLRAGTPGRHTEMKDCGDFTLIVTWQRIVYDNWVVIAVVKNVSQR